jgi:DUF971 family protein
MMFLRTSGSPPVRRSLRTPFVDEGGAQPVELLERQHFPLGQEGHVLGHAVDAAEVAAVGHRYAQIADRRPKGSIIGEPVGNYAVRIHFDDLHNTGIFSWDYFLKLARDRDEMWGGYLKDLEAKGLSRDPKHRK